MDAHSTGGVLSFLKNLPDPRGHNTRHSLMAVVTIALLGVMCGSDDWVAVAEYGRCKAQWLSEFLPLENGIPSSHTFRRVFAVLDPAALESCMLAWMQALVKITNGKLVAVDGKSLRRSFARGWDKSGMAHIVSMFVQANRQVLSQIQCDGKGQEIDAIMHLLKLVDVTGAVVTIDALGCQTAIAEKVVESQADYVLAAKDNQKTLAEGVTSVMQELILDHDKKREAPVDYFEQTQEGHGRKETRKVWVSTAVQRLLSTGAQNQPLEGASKPATLRGKGLAITLGSFIFMKGSEKDGQSTQNGRRTDNFDSPRAGLVGPADRP